MNGDEDMTKHQSNKETSRRAGVPVGSSLLPRENAAGIGPFQAGTPAPSLVSDEADRYSAEVENLDPALCQKYGHAFQTVCECARCGLAMYPTDTEGTS